MLFTLGLVSMVMIIYAISLSLSLWVLFGKKKKMIGREKGVRPFA